jgi:hypothetical protein
MSSGFRRYQRLNVVEMRPFVPGESLGQQVSVSATDRVNGSPKAGDMIARNPRDHRDMWLVAAAYFAANFEPEPDQASK